GRNGFELDAQLIFQSDSKSGDYHDDVTHKNYLTWLEQKLIPNLVEKSFLVIDNSSYSNVQVKPNTNSSWRKDES
ncbi:hypothetical protein HHI36_001816, partial [Cryptolaemus montrouzieri]